MWPALSPFKEELISQYKPLPDGILDTTFDSGRVHLRVIFDHVTTALDRIRTEGLAPQGADAWFLDGFAPSRNPEMWSSDVFTRMRPLSHAGTTFSTFTVAGHVRRGLQEVGFSLQKIPGHGRKKEILTGTMGEDYRK